MFGTEYIHLLLKYCTFDPVNSSAARYIAGKATRCTSVSLLNIPVWVSTVHIISAFGRLLAIRCFVPVMLMWVLSVNEYSTSTRKRELAKLLSFETAKWTSHFVTSMLEPLTSFWIGLKEFLIQPIGNKWMILHVYLLLAGTTYCSLFWKHKYYFKVNWFI